MGDDAPPALVLAARGPFRLPAVAVSHGWFQTDPFRWDDVRQRLRRVEAVDRRAVAVTVEEHDDGVAVRAVGAGPASDPRHVADRVRRMLQLDADLAGFPEALRAVDPDLADDLAGDGGGRLLAGATLFEDVVKAVCATNTTWRQAVACINRIAALGDDGAFPEPAAILRAGEDRLRAIARVGYRAPYLTAAARAAIDGTLAEVETASGAGDDEAAWRAVRALSGVGPATAGFLLLLMGHYDRPSIDSATLRVATERWFGGARPTPRQVAARVAPAGRFRGLVVAWSTLRAWQRETGLIPARRPPAPT